jgi:trimeric autotransporter adhesin
MQKMKLSPINLPSRMKTLSRLNMVLSLVAGITVAVVGYSILASRAADKTADLNNDGQVNVLDLSFLLSKWGTTGTQPADINSDNIVSILDLSILLSDWGAVTTPPPPPDPSGTTGAQLPISYDLGSLNGNVRYVATNGNDTTGTGSVSAPYATLSKAISSSISGDNIVIRGGTYRGQGAISIGATKTLKIMAYPGETPIFNGARLVTTGWTDEGSFKYVTYTPRPVTDGVISVTTGQNLTGDGVGKYADQAWVGNIELKQVTAKASLADGKFWVDSVNNRLYITAADVNKGGVEITQMGRFLHIQSPNTSLEGIRLTRYSNNGGEYGVLLIATTADNTLLKNIEIIDSAYSDIFVDGSSNRNDGTKVLSSTLTGSNWSGIGINGTDNFALENSKLTDMNTFDEFTHSPASGAIKTARTWYTKVIGNYIAGNHSHSVWFDISNYQTVIANNTIVDNDGTGVFYEISDDLLLINNYIKSSKTSAQPVKLAGSSGLKLINNTMIGGRDPIGVYTDDRSMPGCANPANPPCGEWGGLRDSYHPYLATMDWIPRIDLMINNITGYATGSSFVRAH